MTCYHIATFVLTGVMAVAAMEAQKPRPIGRLFGVTYGGQGVKLKNAGLEEDLYPVNVNNWWGHVNRRGNLVVYPRFDWTDDSYDGFSRAVLDNRTGFITANGDFYIDPVFPYADRFEQGYAIVGDGGQFGYINKAGDLIVPLQLDGALRFKENMAGVQVGQRCGFINVTGEIVIQLTFARVRSFHDGRAMVQVFESDGELGPLGYINKRGDFIFFDRNRSFADLGDFNDSLARAKVGDHWGYIDKRYRLRIPAQFQGCRDFADGLAAVKLREKWGFIDKAGNWVVPAIYDQVDDFDSKLAMVTLDGNVGYINQNATNGIEPQFEFAQPFFRNYARVSQSPHFGYIGPSGHVMWDPRAPLTGILDVTLQGQVNAIDLRRKDPRPGTRILPAPFWRKALPIPYPPEYLYDEGLPQPLPQ